MERITEYIETNIKLAYKSVTFHFKNFVWFYIALFIVQTLLGIVNISMNNTSKNMRDMVEDEYNSHYVFYYMNTNQRTYFEKAAKYYFQDEYFFDIKQIKDYTEITDRDYLCDIYIKFTEDPQAGFERFSRKYMKGLEEYGEVNCAATPLYTIEQDIAKNNTVYTAYMLIIAGVSLVLLSVLYSIRSNNYGFDYGVYMAFGADKKKLFNNSFWEMTVITLLTFVPSLITSAIINYVVTQSIGVNFTLKFFSYFAVLGISLVVNSLAVLFVIAKTALKTPISLIIAKDNSNLVISPRISRFFTKKNNVFQLTTLSVFRFAKYYSIMIISGVLFASLFVCGAFLSNLSTQKQDSISPAFEIVFHNNTIHTQDDLRDFLLFDGVTGSYKDEYTNIMGLDEHILIKKQNAKITANRVSYDDEYIAMDNVEYHAADNEVIEYLKTKDYSGDLYSIINTPSTIIISDSFNNSTQFDFKVGDKIKLADYYTRMGTPDFMLYGKDLLKEKLKYYIFLYDEVTIGAIIHNDCSDDNLKIYMSDSQYKERVGKAPKYNSVFLFADENLTQKQNEKLYSDLLRFCELKYRGERTIRNVFVRNTYSYINDTIEENAGLSQKLIVISFLILSFSFIIWFFSQTLFYKKRNNEFCTLQTIGFKKRHIRRIFLLEAFYVSIVGVIMYFAISYLMCFGMLKLLNCWLFGYSFRYLFDMPLNTLIFGALFTIVVSFVSTLVCYIIYNSKKKTLVPDM